MKKIKLITTFIIVIGLSLSSLAQEVTIPPKENTHEADSGKVYDYSEVSPSFPGGMQAQMTFIANNIVYPEVAKVNGINGTVFVSFVVEKDGRLTHIKVLRSAGLEIDKEIIKVVKKMPRWKAGTNKGETVRVRVNMPVRLLFEVDISPDDDINIIDEDIDIDPDESGH